MRRFLVDMISEGETTIRIEGGEAYHLTRVLRMGRGDRCVVMDRSGSRVLAEILEAAGEVVRLKVLEALAPRPSPPVRIVLCQAMLKNPAMDLVVEKASELGASTLRPFLASRSVVKPDCKSTANRIRRWNEIAAGAAKQSDRGAPMNIEPVLTFAGMLATLRRGKSHLNLVLWEREHEETFPAVIDRYRAIKEATVIVGPEGGFSDGEIASAGKAGARSVGLGSRILKAETAAIVITTLLQYEYRGFETS